jgi:hypothetical protein
MSTPTAAGALLQRIPAALPPAYSICTLVTRPAEYAEMRGSFARKGFTPSDCEFLFVDNSAGNALDAYAAYNLFLQEAAGPLIILCHQDILLLEDGREELDAAVTDLGRRDPHWGLFGNAGARADGALALRITDPNTGETSWGGPFPAPVVTLDENFIVVRRSANLALSRDLSGFHLYGADLCIIAGILGWNAYVVDFHLLHKSGGNVDAAFHAARADMQRKYRRALRSRWIHGTTLHPFFLAGPSLRASLAAPLRRVGKAVGLVKRNRQLIPPYTPPSE